MAGFTTAMIVGSSLAAASQLGAAKMGSSAAKKAAKTQSQATDRALAAQREVNQPYMQIGQQALGYLSQPREVVPFNPGGPPMSLGQGMQGGQPQARPVPLMGQQSQAAPAMSLGGAMRNTGTGTGQPQGMGTGMVMLRAPDGSTKSVPASLAPRYLAAGAQRVG